MYQTGRPSGTRLLPLLPTVPSTDQVWHPGKIGKGKENRTSKERTGQDDKGPIKAKY